jgi:DNA repair protein RadA
MTKEKKKVTDIKEKIQEVEDSVFEPIENLDGIGSVRANRFHQNGIFTIMDLAVCSPIEIKDITGLEEEAALDIVSKAKQVLEDKEVLRKSTLTAREIYDYRKTKIDRLLTGSAQLDDLLAGGLESESITEFYGMFGSGKTQVCHSAAVRVQLPKEQGGLNGTCIWLDTENTFRPERIIQIAVKNGYAKDEKEAEKFLDGIIVKKAYNAGHQTNIIDQLNNFLATDLQNKQAGDPKPKLLVVDSLVTHFRSEYLGRGYLAIRQSKLGAHLRKIGRLIETWKMVCIITNQVLSDPAQMFGDPIKPVGGNIVGHISTYRIYLKKSGKKRVAKMDDSPCHEQREVIFSVNEGGVVDAET